MAGGYEQWQQWPAATSSGSNGRRRRAVAAKGGSGACGDGEQGTMGEGVSSLGLVVELAEGGRCDNKQETGGGLGGTCVIDDGEEGA